MTYDPSAAHGVDLICLGEPLVEFNHHRDGQVEQGFGGDTSNCAIAAARQGARVGYVSAVGDDAHGAALFALWAREGVDARHVRVSRDYPTGYYTVTHNSSGHDFRYHRSGSAASHLSCGELPMAYLCSTRVLHVSAISQAISAVARDCVLHAIRQVRRHGVRVSYDTNLRLQLWSLDEARSVIHAAISECDIALPGLEDAQRLTGLDDPLAIVDFYQALGPHTVVLTLGANGALVANGLQRVHVPGVAVSAVDATAAGDTFDGALLACWLDGASIESAARYANVAAALSTTRYGAVQAMPTRAEVELFARNVDGARR